MYLTPKKSIGKFKSASKISFSIHDSYVHLKGLSRYSYSFNDQNTYKLHVSQLLLCAASQSVFSLYSRLIKRCIRLISISIESLRDQTCQQLLVCLGGGVFELCMSLIMKTISNKLIQKVIDEKLFSIDSMESQLEYKVSHEVKKSNFINHLVEELLSNCLLHPREASLGTLREIIFICNQLALAYQEIPKRLIGSYHNKNKNSERNNKLLLDKMKESLFNKDDLNIDIIKMLNTFEDELDAETQATLLYWPLNLQWQIFNYTLDTMSTFLRVEAKK